MKGPGFRHFFPWWQPCADAVVTCHRSINAAIFGEDAPSDSGRVQRRFISVMVLVLLFLGGIVHWVVFFRAGQLTGWGDWHKEGIYYAVLRDWVRGGPVPYHLSIALQGTNRFLAVPETLLSPQAFLLNFMDIGAFVTVNTVLLSCVGFFGCLRLGKKFGLSLLPQVFLILLFQFNGQITSHLSAGHSMWNGYFLLPFFCLYVFDWLDSTDSVASRWNGALKIALVLFAMNLQGSFHIFISCVIFLVVLAASNRRLIRPASGAIALGAWLSAFRLIPATLTFWKIRNHLASGYPTVMDLIHSFVTLRAPTFGNSTSLTGHAWGGMAVDWWEYDTYVGVVGFVFLLYLGIGARFRSAIRNPALNELEYRGLDWPLIVMFLFSVSLFAAIVALVPLPFVSAERVPSRFLIVPTVIVIVLSAARMQRVLPWLRATVVRKTLALWACAQMAFELATHSMVWRIGQPGLLPFTPLAFEYRVVEQYDPLYVMSVQISVLLSMIGFGVVFICLWRPAAFQRTFPRSARGPQAA